MRVREIADSYSYFIYMTPDETKATEFTVE